MTKIPYGIEQLILSPEDKIKLGLHQKGKWVAINVIQSME
jgi:hypothetical protein